MYQEKNYKLWFTFSNQSDVYSIAYSKQHFREDLSLYVFAYISFAKVALKKVFNTSRILADFVVKLDDIFRI